MQLNPLTVKDPLTDQAVIINIQVSADHKNRDERSVLVTAGISGQVPIMLSGHYGQLNQLIDQAWRKFSQNKQESTSAGVTIASAKVTPTKKPDQSKPNKESILSLF